MPFPDLSTLNYVTVSGSDGSPLPAEDHDHNIMTLAQAIQWVKDNPSFGAYISNVTVENRRMKVWMSNGDYFGPFLLPRATMRWRGNWSIAQAYLEMDVVRVPGYGVYLVLEDHTSAISFDPEAINSSGSLYKWLFGDTQLRYETKGSTTFSPTDADANCLFLCTNASGCVVDLPDTFEDGGEMHFRQGAAGAVSFTASTTTLIEGVDGFDNETAGQGSMVTVKWVGSYWIIYGRLRATA